MPPLRVRLATDAGRFLARYATLGWASWALGAQENAGEMASGQQSAEADGRESIDVPPKCREANTTKYRTKYVQSH